MTILQRFSDRLLELEVNDNNLKNKVANKITDIVKRPQKGEQLKGNASPCRRWHITSNNVTYSIIYVICKECKSFQNICLPGNWECKECANKPELVFWIFDIHRMGDRDDAHNEANK